jgi:hypothetical protein
MSKKWQISRRRMLKGVGACMALPFLDAMALPGMSSPVPSKSPLRTAFIVMPNGVHPHHWTPATVGRGYEFTQQLLPLKHLQDDFLVLGELMNMNSLRTADGHYTKTANLLTSTRIRQTTGDNINSGGVSIDQVIANHVGGDTLFPSLEYGLDRIATGVDINVGLTRLYASSISWKTATQPLTKEIDPKMAFDRLFGRYVPGAKIKNDPWKQSVLDAVLDDAKSLKRNLGRSDQDKLTEYLDSVYSLEKRISDGANQEKFAANLTGDVKKELIRLNQNIEEYAEVRSGVDVTEKTRMMLDIMALAFWSDASRVSTFLFGNSVSNRNFSFLPGVNDGHHSISHHMDDEKKLAQYVKITQWHMEQYAYFIEKLKSMKEGESNVFDNSMIMFSSDLRDGNRHSPRNLPVLLAGRAGGRINPGQNLIYEKETPLANLYVTMLEALDIEKTSFADSTGKLANILA